MLSTNSLHAVFAERVIRTLAGRLHKAMFASDDYNADVHIERVVKEYNNTKVCNAH